MDKISRDELAGTLGEIREVFRAPVTFGEFHAVTHRARRLLTAVDEVLKLHVRQEVPTRCWDLDLRCEKHQWTKHQSYGPFEGLRENLLSVRNCPDCTYRERHPCTHCREDDWPCPTVQAISSALLAD